MGLSCLLCGSPDSVLIAEITSKPSKEVDYGIKEDEYRREVYKCRNCSAYFNFQNVLKDDLYRGDYNKFVYSRNLLEKYQAIMELPEELSDNKQRAKRIVSYCDDSGWDHSSVNILDVGSGLCVFLGQMKKYGFKCYCIDPDPQSVEHAINNVKVDGGYVGTIEDLDTFLKFDILTFNKVLEHTKNPVEILKNAARSLTTRGIIYLELPDGKNALAGGQITSREEFYIEHNLIFDLASVNFLIREAGLVSLEIKEIHEPSDKFTIYAFVGRK